MPVFVIISFFRCRGGGIGRRTGLKIQRGQLHGGSIPPPAPSKLRAYRLVGFFYVCQKRLFYAIPLTLRNALIDFL